MTLLTWNTRGNNPSALILNEAAQGFNPPLRNMVPNYICIQEAGDGGWGGNIGGLVGCAWNPAPSFGGYRVITNAIVKTTQYNGYMVPWQANLAGNQRCNLVILWHAGLGAHAAFPINGWSDGNNAHRPTFWVTPVAGRRVGCVHAPSGGNMIYINNALAAIAAGAPGAGWTLAGDFNMNPGALVGLPVGAAVIHSNGQTQQSGGNLDYLIHNGVAPYGTCGSAGAYVGNSDHLQVRFL
jgi:hypothetical protein